MKINLEKTQGIKMYNSEEIEELLNKCKSRKVSKIMTDEKYDYIKNIEKQKINLINLLEYCCYDENFDAFSVITKLKEIINE